jgi:major membrane immunogen (membrane-anchored lipoprotein)
MNRLAITLAAVSSLALAACGGSKTADPVATDTAMATTAAVTPASFPTVPANARTTVKFDGTYTHTGSDGKASTMVLGPNDSWTMTDADGKVTKGTYNWYSDNSRILIKNGNATDVYAIADGALYRMSSKDAAVTGPFDESMTWRRSAM